MLLFLKLLLAHIIGDFLLQPNSWVAQKASKKIKAKALYYHIAIHAFLLALITEFNIANYGLYIIFIVITHFFIDVLKLYLQKNNTKRQWFFIDQILHIAVLVIVVFLDTELTLSFNNIITKQLLLLIIALLLITKVSAVIIKIIIAQWTPKVIKQNKKALSKAGSYIGVLERLFIFVFVVTNHWEGIGFLLAAKSIFRFGDLTNAKDIKLTEYILIGTLLSFGLAIALSLVYNTVLNSL